MSFQEDMKESRRNFKEAVDSLSIEPEQKRKFNVGDVVRIKERDIMPFKGMGRYINEISKITSCLENSCYTIAIDSGIYPWNEDYLEFATNNNVAAKTDFNEVNNMEQETIKDSGERTEFSTGAVRDMHEGKGDMASIPWESILRLSKHYEHGAIKYERWNFRRGIPVSSFIDSACRHLAKYQCGCDDEDHLAAAAFNILGAMLMENKMPQMQDLPLRMGKNTFDYFTTQNK